MNNSILTNITSLKIQRTINLSQKNISTALERMSSGLKINHAKDNAANCTISSKLKNKISGLETASNNTMQATELLNTADSALNNMIEKIQRVRELCLQAMNSTLGEKERAIIQEEIEQLTLEVQREKETVSYNNFKIFDKKIQEKEEILPYAKELKYIEASGLEYIDTGFVINKDDNYKWVMSGDFRGNSNCYIGANGFMEVVFNGNEVSLSNSIKTSLSGNDKIECSYNNNIESLTVNGVDISTKNWSSWNSNNIKIGAFRLGNANNTWYHDANASKFKGKISSYQLYKDDVLVADYIPVVDHYGTVCMYDKISEKLMYNAGIGEFKEGPPVKEPPQDKIFSIQIGADAGLDNKIDLEIGFDFVGITNDVLTIESARNSLKEADGLIKSLSKSRSKIGSALNRMETIYELNQNNIENLNIANSLITDTDMAQEASNLTQSQILQQISTSLFTQSHNISSGLALKLLANWS